MSKSLEILVLEADRGAADVAVDDLERAGHTVHRCHEANADVFPCKALTDPGACPLDHSSIDVAVTVRGRPRSHPAEGEDGVACAIKHHVPVVVAGRTILHPYEQFAAATTDMLSLVETVERVAGEDLPHHLEAVRAAMAQFALQHSLSDGAVGASVVRSHGTIKVRIALPPGLPQQSTDMAAVRAVSAIRGVDPDAGGIDVAIVTAPAESR